MALAWWLAGSPKPVSAPTFPPFESSPSLSPVVATNANFATPEPIEGRRKEVVEGILGVLAAPITFYGRVIDQNGDPVVGADVGYSALDRFMQPGTGYTGTSDKNGEFSISSINGARLSVNVRKKGYYFIDGKSNAAFAYGTGPDGYFQSPPVKGKPAIFILQKMGATEPLIYVGTRYYKVTKNGQPMEVNLTTGREISVGQGDIRFERWATDQTKTESGRFDWRFRITVPKGGIIERKDQFAFEAPQTGYQNAVEINMPSSLGKEWEYTVNKSYFVQLPGGRYARINATIQAGHNSTPLVFDAFVNPNSGSRNLEFDPKNVVKSP
jgi:hypothetical protein